MSSRLLSTIGRRLARLSASNLAEIVHPVSAWLSEQGERLLIEFPVVFDLVWNAMVAALIAAPKVKQYPRPDRAWVDEGLNSPVGRMVDVLFKDPAKTTFEVCEGLPGTWLRRLNSLLDLPSDHRPHAVVMIAGHLNWLFQTDPNWTQSQLLSLSSGVGDDSRAFWAGYFWRAQNPQRPLYLRLKSGFIALARQTDQRRNNANALARMLLAGWGDFECAVDSERLITDVELREVLIHAEDDFRTQMLWYLKHWALEAGGRWSDRLIPFLTQVWPRQRDVRTALVSARLVDLALAIPERFPEIVEAILPKLVPTNGALLRISPSLAAESSNAIATRHPQTLLKLLWVVLGEDSFEWPDGVEKILSQLAEKAETQNDPRLAELRRRGKRR